MSALTPAAASRAHSPEDWWLRGVYPRCSCGHAPRDNGQLYEHWAEFGISWYDAHGNLEWRSVTA